MQQSYPICLNWYKYLCKCLVDLRCFSVGSCKQVCCSERQGCDRSHVLHHKSQKAQPEHLHVRQAEVPASQSAFKMCSCWYAGLYAKLQCHLLIMCECSCPNRNPDVAPHRTVFFNASSKKQHALLYVKLIRAGNQPNQPWILRIFQSSLEICSYLPLTDT